MKQRLKGLLCDAPGKLRYCGSEEALRVWGLMAAAAVDAVGGVASLLLPVDTPTHPQHTHDTPHPPGVVHLHLAVAVAQAQHVVAAQLPAGGRAAGGIHHHVLVLVHRAALQRGEGGGESSEEKMRRGGAGAVKRGGEQGKQMRSGGA